MRILPAIALLLVFPMFPDPADAAPKGFLYDEEGVPEYELPDVLGGASSAEEWEGERRPELLRLFEEHVYGHAPDTGFTTTFEVVEHGEAFGGKANRRQTTITVTAEATGRAHSFDLLLYTPADASPEDPLPAFLGLNFRGNHTTADDPAIRMTEAWVSDRRDETTKDNRALESARGFSASRWPVELLIEEGFAIGTVYCGEIEPDHPGGRPDGIRAIFPDDDESLTWGAIGGWAFGLSRALDVMATDLTIDGEKVAVIGHSRLGKTALWAGAQDERFHMVVSNNSGCGGAALSRRTFGETVKRITNNFPHWFTETYTGYADREGEAPVDQHQLISLIAPRKAYVASASEDLWADPRGEFLSLQFAAPAFNLYAESPDLPEASSAPGGRSTSGARAYHIRVGKHDITPSDWELYLDFAAP